MSEIVAAGINTVGNLVSSLIGGSGKPSYSRNTRLLMEDQYNYSKQLMQDQASINQAQTREDRAYNSPSAQVQRLMAAGLNPVNRSLDGGLVQTPAVSGQSAPDAAAAAAADAQAKQADLAMMMNLTQGVANFVKTMAEAKNLNANTKKVEEETEGLTIDNHYKSGVYEMNLKASNVQIEVGIAQKELTYKQKDKLDADMKLQTEELNKVVAETRKIVAETVSLENEEQFRAAMRKIDLQSARLAVKQLGLNIRISEEQLREMKAMAPFIIGGYALQYAQGVNEVKIGNQAVIRAGKENELLDILLPKNAKEKEVRQWLNQVKSYSEVLGSILGAGYNAAKPTQNLMPFFAPYKK